jgi:hypothetical protein
MNPTMNQRKQTRTERSKIREQNFDKEAIATLKRRIALLEEENGILKQAVKISERANADAGEVISTCGDSLRQASRLANIKRARSGYLIRNFDVLPENERVKGVKREEFV